MTLKPDVLADKFVENHATVPVNAVASVKIQVPVAKAIFKLFFFTVFISKQKTNCQSKTTGYLFVSKDPIALRHRFTTVLPLNFLMFTLYAYVRV